jgi:NAD(P)-dependent dehydrogenase (short-subunit alcohol dehydrogenase family)
MTQLTVEGSVALVTGANRGLGKAFARALLDAGAKKVYAAARDVSTIEDPDVVPVALDVTDHDQVAEVAGLLGDVNIVINNAGVASGLTATGGEGLDGYRAEFEVNYFGLVAVARAFAPVVARNGGGAIVNMLSALSWATFESTANYSATKAAGWAYTNGLRQSLAEQGTLVVAVHAGYIDTDMVAHIDAPKVTPQEVAQRVVEGIDAGASEVLADDVSRWAKSQLAA